MAIHPTAIIDASVELGRDVAIGPYAVIGAGVILRDAVEIGAHAVVMGPTDVGPGTRIFHHAVIGADPQDKKYGGETSRLVIGENNTFREFSTANRGTGIGNGCTQIGDNNLFMAYTHVAHDCVIGDHCVLVNCASLAGHVHMEDHVIMAGLSAVHQHTRIGRCAMVAGGAMVVQDIPPFTLAQGDRARLFGLNIVGLRRRGYKLDTINALRGAYRELFQQGLALRVALVQVREVYTEVPEVQELVEFISKSKRGVCRSMAAEPAGVE